MNTRASVPRLTESSFSKVSYRSISLIAGLACLCGFLPVGTVSAVDGDYPQHPASVRIQSVEVPDRGVIGEPFSFKVSLEMSRDVEQDRLVFFHFRRDGELYFVADLWPEPPTSLWTPGVTVEVSVWRIGIPPDLAPGYYTLHAGVYGEINEEGLLRDDAVATVEMVAPRGKDLPANREVMSSGVFRDKFGVPHRWYIGQGNTLIWDGVPWFPVGGSYFLPDEWETFAAELNVLKKWEVKDLYLDYDVAAAESDAYPMEKLQHLQKALDSLDENGFRYGMRLASPPTEGAGFRFDDCVTIDEITESGEYAVDAEGTGHALYMVYNRTLRTLVEAGEVEQEGDSFRVEVDCSPGTTCELSLFMERAGKGPYFWGGNFKAHRDRVVGFYRSLRFGRGLRFVVDPYYNQSGYQYNFIPSAPDYQPAFRKWLENRYGDVQGLNRAWAVLGGYSIPSIESAAKMIPLRTIREHGSERCWLYDPEAERVHGVDVRRSQYWLDAAGFQGEANRDYLNALCDALKTVVDVPIVFKQCSDPDRAMVNDAWPPSGQDGLGVEAYGMGEPVAMMNLLLAVGQAEQHRKTAWVVVTETGQGRYPTAWTDEGAGVGYDDRLVNMYANWNSLLAWGAKGIFHSHLNSAGGEAMGKTARGIMDDPRQLEWMRTYANILEAAGKRLRNYRPTLYYWFPALVDPIIGEFPFARQGESVENEDGYGYRGMVARAHNGTFIVPAFSSDIVTPRLMVNLEDAPGAVGYGDRIAGREQLTWIGFRKNLGAIPQVDEYYSGTFVKGNDGYQYQALRQARGAWILGRFDDGTVWNLRTPNGQILSREILRVDGFQPEFLDIGKEEAIDPWEEFSREVLGLEFLALGDGMRGLVYKKTDIPVACIWSDRREPVSLTFPMPERTFVEALYPDGAEIAPATDLLKITLAPEMGRGSAQGAEDVRNVVLIRGLDKRDLVPREQAAQAVAVLQRCTDEIPGGTENKKLLAKIQEVRGLFEEGKWALAKERADRRLEEIYSSQCPYVWLEAEDAEQTNFSLRKVRAMLAASGNAFLGLDTSAPAPKDTGYFARYRFRIAEEGRYALWVREGYMEQASPSEWRIDDWRWYVVPTGLVPEDVRVISEWAPFDDDRIHMAWYRYGVVYLNAGRHSLEIRVTQPRQPGNQQPEIRDGEYAKSIDTVMLIGCSFVPQGTQRPRRIEGPPKTPTVNLVANSSLERDENQNGVPDGWRRVGEPAEAVYRVTPVGQPRLARIGVSCYELASGGGGNVWQTQAMPVAAGGSYTCRLWTRGEEGSNGTVCSIAWQDADNEIFEQVPAVSVDGDHDWAEHLIEVTAPEGALTARLTCHCPDGGKVWLDDFIFAEVPQPLEEPPSEAE